jgi:hypothetical protein
MAVDSSIIDNAIEFWNIIRDEKVVTVKFEKRSDGSTRIMKCTLDFTLIPKKDYPDKNINIAKILKINAKK